MFDCVASLHQNGLFSVYREDMKFIQPGVMPEYQIHVTFSPPHWLKFGNLFTNF